MICEPPSGGALQHINFGNSLSLWGQVKVIQREVSGNELFLCDVLIESDLDRCIVVKLYLTCVKSFFFSMIEDSVKGVSLSKFFNENLDWHSLLPECDISN